MLVDNMDKFAVGHQHIDADHRVLFEHLSKLEHAVTTHAATEEQQQLLETLIVFTREHFKREESLMAQIAYSGLQKHQAEHQTLLEEVQELQGRLKSGSIVLSAGLVEYLYEWLNFHVVTTDKKLADTIASADKE